MLESYTRRHSWHRTYFGSHSRKLKSGTNLTVGKFRVVFDVKQDWCIPNICTQWWALHNIHWHTVAGGHYTNILMQVERYPMGEEVLYERSRKLRWHSARPRARGVLLSPSLHLSPPSRRKRIFLRDSQRNCLFLCFGKRSRTCFGMQASRACMFIIYISIFLRVIIN